MAVEVVVKNTCPGLGEGPHWMEATQQLAYVDVFKQLHLLDYTTGKDSMIQLDDNVSFFIPKDGGDFIIGKIREICSFEWESKKQTLITKIEDGTENIINDAKCDALGRIWTGTFGPPINLERLEFKPGQGSLYSLDPKRGVKCHMSGITVSNGLGWTVNNDTMFHIDSSPGTLYAYDFNLQEGSLANKRVVVDFTTDPALGMPDGMCVDNNDNLWVAGLGSSKIHNIDPNTGQVVRSIHIPASRVTSCCFGGHDYSELFVTCGNTKSPEENEPLAGSVFKVTGLGVKGRAAYNYCE